MLLRPRWRKALLGLHVATSVGLLGAVAGFLALALTGVAGDSGVYPAMQVLTRTVIVPLALAALLVGIAESLFTRWGLIRHYWIIAKLVLTVIAVVVLLLQLNLIDTMARLAATPAQPDGQFVEAKLALVLHSGGGLLVLVLPLVLSVFKPRGRTGYGIRPAQLLVRASSGTDKADTNPS